MNRLSTTTLPWWRRLMVQLVTLVLIAAFLPLLIVGIRTIRMERSQVIRHTQQITQTQAEGIAERVASHVRLAVTELTVLAGSPPLRTGNWNASWNELERLQAQYPNLAVLTLTDAAGNERVKVSSIEMVLPGELGSRAQSPEFLAAMRGETYLSYLQFVTGTGQRLPVSVPVFDVARQKVIGMLSAKLSLRYLLESVGATRVDSNGYAYIVNEQGHIVAHPDFSLVLANTNASTIPETQEFLTGQMKSQEHEFSAYDSLTGEPVFGVHALIGTPNWCVIVEQPVADVWRPAWVLTVNFAFLLGGTMLLAAGLAVALSLFVARPVTQLTQAAQRLAAGDRSVRVLVRRQDEVGRLAVAFNQMGESVLQAEENLKNSEEKYRILTTSSPVGIFQTDTNGDCVYVNDCWCRLTGMSAEQAAGQGWINALHPDDRDRIFKAWYEFAEGGNEFALEYRFRSPEGVVTWVNGQAVRIFNEQGEITGHIGITSDITERKQAEAERERVLHSMGERVKELRCMYGVTRSIQIRTTIEEIFQDVVELIPDGWHYPEITRGRIVFKGQKYVSEPFEETRWKQSSDIIVNGQSLGSIDVYYLQERTTLDEGPFMTEERNLIDGIARNISEAMERKKTDEALQASEERFKRAVVDSPFPIMIHAEDGEVIQISKVWTELTGYQAHEIDTIANWTEKAYGEKMELVQADIDRVFELGRRTKDGEYQINTNDAKTLTWDFSSAPLGKLPDGRRLVITMAVDVTDRKQAEVELNRLNLHNQLILNTAGEGIYGLDLDGNTTFVNPAAARMIGWEVEEIIGKNQHALLHHTKPDGSPYPAGVCPIYAAYKDGNTHHVNDEVFWRKDGSSFPVEYISTPIHNVHGEIEGAVVTFSDITDRKQAEEHIGSLAKFPSENPNPVLRVSQDGEVLYSNKAGKLLLTEWESGVGKTVPEKWHDLIAKAFASGKAAEEEEEEVKDQIFSFSITPVKESGYANLYARNITDRKKAQREREKLLKELESKNDELQSIVYISSHDLKTPLVNINGFSSLLIEHVEQLKSLIEKQNVSDEVKKEIKSLIDEDIHQDLNIIVGSTSRMKRLIEGLGRVSRIGMSKITLSEVDMNKVVSEIFEIVKYQTDENHTEINIGNLPNCKADEDMIRQVFANLVDNAIKYFKPDQKGIINITGYTDDNRNIYCVEDNGIGIRQDYQDKIFEIYHRLDPRGPVEGEGLGLTIIRRVLDRHDGDIWLESEENKGSKFFVSLLPGD